jgi:hypothetical protein
LPEVHDLPQKHFVRTEYPAYHLQLVALRHQTSPIAVHKQNAHVSRSRLGLNSQDVGAEHAAFPAEVPQRTKTIDRFRHEMFEVLEPYFLH